MPYHDFEDVLSADWRRRSVANGCGDEIAADGRQYRGRLPTATGKQTKICKRQMPLKNNV